ncbi:MAG: response regulator [Psychrosphaera sp.]|nr:response regulator [Psychrosphaera sp.]
MIIKKEMKSLQPDWHILEAASGDLALSLLATEKVDFISADYNMLGISGIEFLAKQAECFPNARCAMLTANIQTSSSVEAKTHHAMFIEKPVTDATIEQMLSYFNE